MNIHQDLFFSYDILLAGLPTWDVERLEVSSKVFAQLPMRKYIARVKYLTKDYISIRLIDSFGIYSCILLLLSGIIGLEATYKYRW